MWTPDKGEVVVTNCKHSSKPYHFSSNRWFAEYAINILQETVERETQISVDDIVSRMQTESGWDSQHQTWTSKDAVLCFEVS